MQWVIRNIFLLDEKLENNLKFHTLLGPFFLILSLALAPLELAMIIALGLFLCFRFKLTGLYISSSLVLLYAGYNHYYISVDHLWDSGLETSIVLGFIISSFSFDEIALSITKFSAKKTKQLEELKNKLTSKEVNLKNHRTLISDNFERIKSDIDEKQSQINLLQDQNETLVSKLDDNQKRKDFLLNELDQKENNLIENQTKIDDLYEKLAFLKDEEFLKDNNVTLQKEIATLQESIVQEKDQNLSLQKQIEEKNTLLENQKSVEIVQAPQVDDSLNIEIEKLKKENGRLFSKIESLKTDLKENIDPDYHSKAKEFNHINSLYFQIKDQFEEKSLVLHRTRKDLFHTKEMLTALKKENENDFDDFSEIEKSLVSDLDISNTEFTNLQKENEKLKDIVTLLNLKLKVDEPKIAKENLDPEPNLPLFD